MQVDEKESSAGVVGSKHSVNQCASRVVNKGGEDEKKNLLMI